jgi:hypothetical protein
MEKSSLIGGGPASLTVARDLTPLGYESRYLSVNNLTVVV